MPFSTTAKNTMLDSLTCDRIRLHSGAPGAAGETAPLGAGLSVASFSAASGGARALASAVEVTGLDANQSVTHFSVWSNAGTVFQGSGAVTGDATANGAGEYNLTTATSLDLDDPV